MILNLDFTSYFVTELLGTDLHRLLQSRPLEKQFIQYFLYQILVSIKDTCKQTRKLIQYLILERIEICSLGRRDS